MNATEMDSLLKYMIIALIVIAGIAFIAVCGDALCVSCGHVCCTGADRSRPLSRLARRLHSACASALSLALMLCGMTHRRGTTARMSFACIPALELVSSLRI